MSRSLRSAVLSAGMLMLLALAPPVSAHSELESAAPGPSDEVSGSPSELVAQFSQDLDPSRTSIAVRDASGAVLADGGALGAGPREWILPLPALVPGEYEVRYTTFSAEDSELHRDSWTFTVVAAPTPAPTPTPSPTPTPTPTATLVPTATPVATPVPAPSAPPEGPEAPSGGGGGGMLAVLASVAAVGVIAIWVVRRRST